ncbi:MAG TPA: hypothetical protein VLX85_06405 [Stellaceae bacterium]|nr:hypothetical protein [Stellaceae bacterium]
MIITREKSAAAEWREKTAELRQVAEATRDPRLRRRFYELALRWDRFADELEDAGTEPARHR